MASEKDAKGNYYLSSLVHKLQSTSFSTVQKTLISVSRVTKNYENVAKFREEGGIKMLLKFIQTSNKKIVDMSSSVLANCALEKESKDEITRLNGLTYLYNVLTTFSETSILSRVTRAFANLSADPVIAQQVVDLDVIPKLVSLLKETKDPHFQQNIVRALRIIGKTDDGKKELVHRNALQFISELLWSESKDVKSCCLQSLQELTKLGNRQIAEQIQEHRAIEAVIELTYSEDAKLRENAVLTLSNITRNASVRVSVGTVGGIEAFIHQIRKRDARSLILASIEGICMCCREAVNRNKVRSCGGLEVLMEILQSPEYLQAHDRILGAFVCFSYDELALNRLIANGIIPVLISLLRKLLFPRTGVHAGTISEKSECQSQTSSSEKYSAIDLGKASSKCLVTSPIPKPVERTACSPTGTQPPRSQCPATLDVGQTSVISPTTNVSPSCSPDLHMSYMSPVHPLSVHDGVPSPMLYSPSGSEAEDYSSSDDSLTEVTPGNEKLFQEMKCSNKAESNKTQSALVSCNSLPPTSGDAIIHAHQSHVQDQRDSSRLSPSTTRSFSTPREIPKEHPTTPILPGAGLSDHSYMFLQKENLFSADQPSPTKSQIPGLGRSRRTRRSSRLLPNPHIEESKPTPSSSVTSLSSSPYSGELRGPEEKILFLLSRFCQMPKPTEALLTPSCIQTLLDYLSFSANPDPRCVRLLNRLVSDINCFEVLVLNMIPGAFYRQLSCGFGPSYHLSKSHLSESRFSQSENITTSKNPLNLKDTCISTDPTTPENLQNSDQLTESRCLSKSTEPSTSKDLVAQEMIDTVETSGAVKFSPYVRPPEAVSTEVQSASPKIPATVPGEKDSGERLTEDDELKGDFSFSPTHTIEISQSLISAMATLAGTSFGEGQLAHLLLRGSQTQKRACALSLPYVCRLMRLKRKLLLEYKGLDMILSALSDPFEPNDMVRATEALTYLVTNSSMALPEHKSLFEVTIGKSSAAEVRLPATVCCHSNNVEGSTATEEEQPKRQRIEESPKSIRSTMGTPFGLAVPPTKIKSKSTTKRRKLDICERSSEIQNDSCSYNKMESKPYDVTLKLDGGESIEAHRSVLSTTSEVFSAMLSSDYVESSQREVMVKNIDYQVLLFLVHYAYGCRWYFQPVPFCSSSFCTVFEKCLQSKRWHFNFDFLSELLVCADRFLLDELKDQCTELLLRCVTDKCVTDLYLFGTCFNAPVLRDYSLKYMFLGDLDLRRVYQCVRRLLESDERFCVLEDLRRLALCCF